MEFITMEQFREQPIKVQKIFLDWWECDYGDLYYYNEDPHEYKDVEIIDNNLECDLNGDFDYFKSIGPIPLFTEGQLRKFIEDRTDTRIDVYQYQVNGNYDVLLEDDLDNTKKIYKSEGYDLLQAYWKMACEIAVDNLI